MQFLNNPTPTQIVTWAAHLYTGMICRTTYWATTEFLKISWNVQWFASQMNCPMTKCWWRIADDELSHNLHVYIHAQGWMKWLPREIWKVQQLAVNGPTICNFKGPLSDSSGQFLPTNHAPTEQKCPSLNSAKCKILTHHYLSCITFHWCNYGTQACQPLIPHTGLVFHSSRKSFCLAHAFSHARTHVFKHTTHTHACMRAHTHTTHIALRQYSIHNHKAAAFSNFPFHKRRARIIAPWFTLSPYLPHPVSPSVSHL